MFEVGEFVILNQNIEKGLPGHSGEVVEIVRKIKSPNYDYEVDLGNSINPVKETEITKLNDGQKELIKYIYKGNRLIYIPSDEKVTITKVDFIHNQVAIKFDDFGAIVVGFESLKKIDKESVSLTTFKFNKGDKVKVTSKDRWDGLVGEVIEAYKENAETNGYDVYFGNEATCFSERELDLIGTEVTEQSDKFTQIGLEIGKFTDMKNKQYGSSVDATNEMMKVLMERYTYDDENYLMPKSLLQHILLQVRIMDKQNRIFNNPSGEGDSESPYNDITGYGIIGVDMVSDK